MIQTTFSKNRQTKRRIEREKQQYKVKNNLIDKVQHPNIGSLIESIKFNKVSDFGLVKLSQFDLSILIHDKTLLDYSSIYKRDLITIQLIKAGCDPTLSKYYSNKTKWNYNLIPQFQVYLINLLTNLRNSYQHSNCWECHHQIECFQLNCKHFVCEDCFFNLIQNLKFKDLKCYCGIEIDSNDVEIHSNDVDLHSNDVEIQLEKLSIHTNKKLLSKNESLELYNNLPIKLQKSERLAFKALKMSQLNAMYLGTFQTQRTTELFKAIQIGNGDRLIELINHGIHMDIQNEYGQTPLMVAHLLEFNDIIDILKYCGANDQIPDNTGLFIHQINSLDSIHVNLQSNFQLTRLLQDYPESPGFNSSFYMDDIFSNEFIDTLLSIFHSLPIAEKQKLSCSNRAYYYDTSTLVQSHFKALFKMLNYQCLIPPQMRFLHYPEKGGFLPAHTDLSRNLDGQSTTHTFILYILDCDSGETGILDNLKNQHLITKVECKRGRLFWFPHHLPHEGLITNGQKLLLRGELLLSKNS